MSETEKLAKLIRELLEAAKPLIMAAIKKSLEGLKAEQELKTRR